jgi:HEPN domain-containing protein
MRAELEDLSEDMREELQRVLRIIFDEFDHGLATATQPWKKAGRILKVLLRPSTPPTRADRLPEPRSAFDLLVVVNDERLTSHSDYWAAAEDRLFREREIRLKLKSRITLLVHTLTDVNRALAKGTPFFVDLVTKSLALYDYGGAAFVRPRHLPVSEARAAAKLYFEFWYPLSINARELARDSAARGVLRDAAFLYHQAVERAYHCVLLTLTLHSPKTHRLELLRSNGERAAPFLADAWPSDSKFEKRCFERLRRSYLEARYSETFRIGEEELGWIDQRVEVLQRLVRIEKATQDLPSITREVFKARRLECLEYEEIGDRLGLSTDEVELRMARALDSVAGSLED